MHHLKRTLALAIALVLLLAGCSKNPVQTNSTDETPFIPPNSVPVISGDDGSEATTPTYSAGTYYLPAEVDNPDGLPVLKWLCLGTARKSEAAMQEINRVLAEKNMPFRLQFVLYSGEANGNSWFSLKNVTVLAAEADLISGSIQAEEAVQYLEPLTKNATGTAAPSLEKAFIHDSYLNKTTIDGEVYGIPAITAELEAVGWSVDSSVLTNGLTEEDFQRQYWEMDDVFAQIYANNNNRPFLSPISSGVFKGEQTVIPSAIQQASFAEFQQLAACYGIDYTLETPAVVSILDTDRIRLTQAAMKRYIEAGYVTSEGSKASATVKYTRLHADFLYSDDDKLCIPTGKTQAAGNAPSGFMTGISAASQNKEAALTLLALIADDLDFRTLLFFGREGKEYQIEDGVLRSIPDEDGYTYNMGSVSSLSDFCGLTLNYHAQYFPTQNGETLSESFPAMLERSVIRYPLDSGYGFDTTAVEAEITAVNKILEDEAGAFATLEPEAYDGLLQKIKDAGGDKIQAELQRQLDEWLAANPDWGK